ncbi:recombinase family protein [Mesorhizobium sp. A556]
MNSKKIGAQHLARKAVLYVRQSFAHQVPHNRESRALQYAMRGRLTQLGWSEIDIIHGDLGRSAAGGVTRPGFERKVAAREVSRFARNSHDWQQLVEMCRVVDTLLIDQETVYAPRLGNDRLLLGLKGSLNEYELDLLRQRSLAARHAKALRGELVVAAPVGFVKVGDRLEKDPDRRGRRRSDLSSIKWPRSAAPVRRSSGSSSAGSTFLPDAPTEASSGVARAIRPSIRSSIIPPMAVPSPGPRHLDGHILWFQDGNHRQREDRDRGAA